MELGLWNCVQGLTPPIILFKMVSLASTGEIQLGSTLILTDHPAFSFLAPDYLILSSLHGAQWSWGATLQGFYMHNHIHLFHLFGWSTKLRLPKRDLVPRSQVTGAHSLAGINFKKINSPEYVSFLKNILLIFILCV